MPILIRMGQWQGLGRGGGGGGEEQSQILPTEFSI